MPKPTAIIIGAGIGGLATAILLAKQGYSVEIFEKHDSVGGRARQFSAKGFTFDMGPSWYLMPEVFEQFFRLINEDIAEYFELERLSPAYKVFFESQPPLVVAGDIDSDAKMFESIEQGAGKALRRYVARAEKTYNAATEMFLYTNFSSPKSFVNTRLLKDAPYMGYTAIKSIDSYVSSYVTDPRLKKILEYPMVFLGASPYNAPALYHLMSFMDFSSGVYYPKGGIHSVIRSLETIATKYGVTIHLKTPVASIITTDGVAKGISTTQGKVYTSNIVISNADMHFSETKLLPEALQTYPESYWKKKTPGPSALLFYLGIKGKLPQLEHHNLFFTDDWRKNFGDIFDTKQLPHPASMYVCKPSATDDTVAPKDHENVFILVPLPSKDSYTKKEFEKATTAYYEQFKSSINEPDLDARIVYKQTFTPEDFASEYNSWQGSALGMSHTLKQSALFRPRNKSKKVDNLYYVGGNTIPGIGLPMCLISAELILKHLRSDKSNGPTKDLK